jgi:uncharacterized membrane protein
MTATLLQDLLAWDTLLATGVCLVLLGLVVRGLARQSTRDAARRRQHQSAERTGDIPVPIAELGDKPDWVERHYPQIANTMIYLGLILALAGFIRR